MKDVYPAKVKNMWGDKSPHSKGKINENNRNLRNVKRYEIRKI